MKKRLFTRIREICVIRGPLITAILAGKNSETGIGLLEIYSVPGAVSDRGYSAKPFRHIPIGNLFGQG